MRFSSGGGEKFCALLAPLGFEVLNPKHMSENYETGQQCADVLGIDRLRAGIEGNLRHRRGDFCFSVKAS